MTSRCRIGFMLGCFAILPAACGHDAAPARTEVLPSDGGDLGKAYLELAGAMKAADKDRAGRLLDPDHWHLANKEKSWFGMFDGVYSGQPAGGRIQGDRATLFLTDKAGNPLEFRYMSATKTSSGWQFDAPTTLGSSFSKAERDCSTSKMFPCGVQTAPDSVVSGTITAREPAPGTSAKSRVIDGIAVRMVDAKNQVVGSRVLLSIHGINPAALALSRDPDNVKGWLAWPAILLDIPPGGGAAKMEYYDGASRKTIDVAQGLSIQAGTPDRIRGQLKTEADKVAFDLHFDLGTASSCQADAYNCGPDASP
jgi:hypothetical protein